MKIGEPKLKFQGLNVDKDLRTRTVFITDTIGSLVKTIVVESYLEADIIGTIYRKNWRADYVSGILRPGQYILCDDGYVSKVTRVGYNHRGKFIEIETGLWKFPNMAAEKLPKFLDEYTITTAPHFKLDPDGSDPTLKIISDKMLKYRKLAKNYLATFDRDTAYMMTYKPTDKGHHKNRNTVFADHQFRYVLMSEATRFFEKAGVPPEVILDMVNRKVAEDGDVEQHLAWMKLYSRMHPDMELKDENGKKHGMIDLGDSGGGANTNFYLGDANYVQNQITDGAKGGGTNSTGKIEDTPPSPDSNAEVVDDVKEIPDAEGNEGQV